MSGSVWQAGASDVRTYWRAIDSTTGNDYAGDEINHDDVGLRIGYYRPGAAAAVEAVTAGSPAPVDVATPDLAHTDWGWGRIVGPFYFADFPDNAFITGAPQVVRWVRGIADVVFVPVTLDEIMATNPRTPLTSSDINSAVESGQVGTDAAAAAAALDTLVADVVAAVQAAGVTLTSAQVTVVTKSVFRAIHYVGGYGVSRNEADTQMTVIQPGESNASVSITPDTGRPSVVAAGAGVS